MKAFGKAELRKLAGAALESGAAVVSDGLNCFAAVTDAGCTHTAIVTGSEKHVPRYLAEFEYRYYCRRARR